MSPESNKDVVGFSNERQTTFVVTPRVLLITGRGIPMVKKRGWLGLPGGKVKENEIDGNLLSAGAFPALTREVYEECGFDISGYLHKSSACLGLADIFKVDSETRTIEEMYVPVFLCLAPDLDAGNEDVVWRKTDAKSFRNVFPDAKLALKCFRRGIKQGRRNIILPEFLNHKEIYFQTRSTMGYLDSRPSWVSGSE